MSKPEKFASLLAPDWESTRAIAKSLVRWGFRGQEHADWPLENSLRRGTRLVGCPAHDLAGREDWMLRQFQRRAHRFIADPPSCDQKLDWLALIQHYGGPTRLLDFSHSFYVAAFFAVERAQWDAAVWAVNLDMITAAIAKRMDVRYGHENIDEMNTRHMEFVAPIIGEKTIIEENSAPLFVVNVEPERLHERLTIQQGFFLFPYNVAVPFAKNLAATFEAELDLLRTTDQHDWNDWPQLLKDNRIAVLKITIPRSCHKKAIEDLHRMNVTSAALFPGLDGFARSLYFHLRQLGG